MKKTLVVSGCSFTFESWNWPTPLAEKLDMDLINVAMGCQGNELIAKKLMFKVNELLKEKKPEDIKVGIMWSGIDRHSVYMEHDNLIPTKNTDGWNENPTSVTGQPNDCRWVILNWGWKTPLAKAHYGKFHSDVQAISSTLENIILVQSFLKKYNIEYFMTTYMEIFGEAVQWKVKLPELKYLYDMIDFDKFLPIKGEYEWIVKNHPSGIPPISDGTIHIHPSEEGHEYFVENCIYPNLKKAIDEAKW